MSRCCTCRIGLMLVCFFLTLHYQHHHTVHCKLTQLVESCGSNDGNMLDGFYRHRSASGRRSAVVGRCVSSPYGCKAVGGYEIADGRLPSTTSNFTFQYGCSNSQVCCLLEPAERDYECNTCGVTGASGAPHHYELSSNNLAWHTLALTATVRNEFCWHVLIVDSDGIVGSGALISRNHVLTAASVIAG